MTIGYEGCTLETFFHRLTQHNVQTLIDVRELPVSRKKGFSKTALREAAQTYGIGYVHIRALGCPRPIRHDYRSDQDWQQFTHRYLEYLDTQDTALAELALRVQDERCCLMCMEANPNTCHRLFIAQRLSTMSGNNLEVIHII